MTLQVTGCPISADTQFHTQASACWIFGVWVQLNEGEVGGTRACLGGPGRGEEKPLTLPGIEGSLVNTSTEGSRLPPLRGLPHFVDRNKE